jgi:ABC-2 type transport system permease protein
MKYLSQVVTVTRWEFRRFFKPKNEAIGIAIMIIVSSVFYFLGKMALSDSGEKPVITIIRQMDSGLLLRLSTEFQVKRVAEDQKASVLQAISTSKQGILLLKNNDAYVIHAYKNMRILKKLKAALEDDHRVSEMHKLGLKEGDLAKVMAPAPIVESFVYTDNSGSRTLLAYFFAGLMLLAVFLSFAYQFTAITGEKQLKITEQIVSAIKPQIWMDGKIYGITLTGLASIFTYSILSIAGGILFFQFTDVPVSSILNYLYLPSILIYLPFALTGILIWNAILAAIASMITDPNNSGKSGLMMLPVLFVLASFLVTRDPDSKLAVFLSWFPLTSASSMPMRWAVTEVEYWQIAASFILLLATFYFLRKLAAGIFRISILMSGKEPSFSEVIKLLKER